MKVHGAVFLLLKMLLFTACLKGKTLEHSMGLKAFNVGLGA